MAIPTMPPKPNSNTNKEPNEQYPNNQPGWIPPYRGDTDWRIVSGLGNGMSWGNPGGGKRDGWPRYRDRETETEKK